MYVCNANEPLNFNNFSAIKFSAKDKFKIQKFFLLSLMPKAVESELTQITPIFPEFTKFALFPDILVDSALYSTKIEGGL